MNRLFLTVLCCLVATNVFAQLPNQSGQVWQEYPAFVEIMPPQWVIEKGNYVPEFRPFGGEVVNRIQKLMGPEAGRIADFGLINCDERKIYVYHTPQMQRKVNEMVARFVKPEFQDVQFTTEARFFSISDSLGKPGSVPDLRAGIFELLHPIVRENNQPISKTPGIHAYWIAKEDLPKFEAAYAQSLGTISDASDSRSNVLQAPKVTTFNGCRGQVQDTSQQPFVTDVIPVKSDKSDSGMAYQPVITIVNEGQWLEVFSLLSFDGKTVTTDFSAAFSKIEKVGTPRVVEKETEENGKEKINSGVTLQVPFQKKTEFALNDITWPADGMLLLFVTGIDRQTEGIAYGAGPFGRFRSKPTVDRQTLNVVVTVKMIEETAPWYRQEK